MEVKLYSFYFNIRILWTWKSFQQIFEKPSKWAFADDCLASSYFLYTASGHLMVNFVRIRYLFLLDLLYFRSPEIWVDSYCIKYFVSIDIKYMNYLKCLRNSLRHNNNLLSKGIGWMYFVEAVDSSQDKWFGCQVNCFCLSWELIKTECVKLNPVFVFQIVTSLWYKRNTMVIFDISLANHCICNCSFISPAG